MPFLKNSSIFLLGFLVLLFLGVQIHYYFKAFVPSFWINQNFLSFSLDKKNLFFLGDTHDLEFAQSILYPHIYLSPKKNNFLDLGVGKSWKTSQGEISRIDENFWILQLQGLRWFVFGENFESFPLAKPISTKSDVWVLAKGVTIPSNLPLPQKAILTLSSKKSTKIENFARENKIPLIRLSDHGSLMIQQEENDLKVKILNQNT